MILSKYALLSTLAACVLMVLTPFATKAATKPDGSYAFSILSATLLAEMSKLVISSVLYIRLPVSQQTHHLVDARYAVSFAVPALIYTANNFLVYLILSLTSAAAFLLLSSTKILFTGILFRLFLKRRLRSVQCSAIVLLAAGVALARAPTCRADDIGSGWQDNDEWAGNALALLSCLLSAFAGIYNEALMKGRAIVHSIHLQNSLLYTFGIAFNLIAIALQEPETLLNRGVLHDFSAIVWALVLLNTLCGLCISAVLKHGDNMLRANASAGSLLLSLLIESVVLGEPPAAQLLLSTVVVGNAVVLYSTSPKPELVAPIIEMVALSEEAERKATSDVVE